MLTNTTSDRPARLMVCAAFLLVTGLALQAARAELPSTVSSRVKKVNAALDQVDKQLEADHLTTAQRKLTEAQKTAKEITDRYKDKFDESDADYKAMTDRLAAATAKVEAAAKAAADKEKSGKEAQAANEALCKEWTEKLKPFTDHKSELYLRVGAELNGASPEDQAKSKAAYAKARELMAEYRKVQFTEKTMELKNVESTLTSTMKYYGEDETAAVQAADCKPWVDKLAPYVEVGMNSPKYLIAAPTVNTEQIKTQQALFEEATKLFQEYKKAEFPHGKTQRMQDIEKSMAETLEEFPKAMARSREMTSGDVGKRLDGLLEYMNRDTSWKTDKSKKPPTVSAADLKQLGEEIDKFAGTVKPDDAKLADLRGKLDTLKKTDAEHRDVRAARTFQRPDGFTGGELAALKDKAKAVAAAAHAKAEILNVTVPSKDWAIEDVIESTDTTHTALRHRVTRSVRAEVALKDAAGLTWVQEIYLGQDRTPDGGWGELKGHTTWADRMAPANVGKTAP